MARLRVSQHVVEVLVPVDTASPTTPTGAGISQHVIEVLGMFTGSGRLSQYLLEVLMADDDQQTDPEDIGGGDPPGAGGTHMYGWAG